MTQDMTEYTPPVATYSDRRQLEQMPKQRLMIDSKFVFSDEAMANIRYGFIPEHMGQRWFIYVTEKNEVKFHRSWTGYCIYEVQLHQATEGWVATEFCVNRDPDQYSNVDVCEDKKIVHGLFRSYLVGKREKPEPEFIPTITKK